MFSKQRKLAPRAADETLAAMASCRPPPKHTLRHSSHLLPARGCHTVPLHTLLACRASTSGTGGAPSTARGSSRISRTACRTCGWVEMRVQVEAELELTEQAAAAGLHKQALILHAPKSINMRCLEPTGCPPPRPALASPLPTSGAASASPASRSWRSCSLQTSVSASCMPAVTAADSGRGATAAAAPSAQKPARRAGDSREGRTRWEGASRRSAAACTSSLQVLGGRGPDVQQGISDWYMHQRLMPE